MKKTLAALTVFLLSHTSAYAAPATPEEAKRLTELFQTYVGKEPGIVAVVPAGEAYDVTLDMMALAKKTEGMAQSDLSKTKVKMPPFVFHLTPQDNGKWVVAQDMPLDWSVVEPGKTTLTIKADSIKTDAIFDEKLMVFSSYKSDITNLSGVMQDDGRETKDSPILNFSVTNIHADGDAKSTGAGVFDGDYKVSMNGFSAAADSLPQTDGSAPISGKVTLDKLGYSVLLKGVKGQAFLDMIKWGIALPPENQGKDGKLTPVQQGEVKALIVAAMPFFQSISINYGLDKLAITSPLGNAGLDKVTVAVDLSGAVKDGFFREAISLEGLTTPQGILPPWSDPLMPDKFVIDFKVSDLDLESVTKLAIAEPEILNNNSVGDVKATNDDKLLKAIIPSGSAKLTLQVGKLAGKTYDFDFSGSVSGGPEVMPTGSGLIKAKDLIPLITALQALPPELGMAQASPVLIAFNSMAKKQADGTLQWYLDGTTFGKFLINGVDFMSLLALGGVSPPEPIEDLNAVDGSTIDGSATDDGDSSGTNSGGIDATTDEEPKDPAKAE